MAFLWMWFRSQKPFSVLKWIRFQNHWPVDMGIGHWVFPGGSWSRPTSPRFCGKVQTDPAPKYTFHQGLQNPTWIQARLRRGTVCFYSISEPYVHIRNLNLPIFLKTASSMPLKCLAPSFIMEANPGARPTFIAILKSSRGSLLALERTLQILNSTLKIISSSQISVRSFSHVVLLHDF